MGLSIPLVWAEEHRLHDPDSAVWIGTRVPNDEVPARAEAIRAALEEAGIGIESADTTMVASTQIELADEGSAKQVLRVIDALEDHDDVQGVYANFDIPESVLDAVVG